jgi:hypothetical protein
MSVNLLIDLAIGIIPFIGDLFDVVSRSNSKNLELFRRMRWTPTRPRPVTRRSSSASCSWSSGRSGS